MRPKSIIQVNTGYYAQGVLTQQMKIIIIHKSSKLNS